MSRSKMTRRKTIVKIKLLPTTFEDNGCLSARQHTACLVVDDRVAFDAGSLAFAANDVQRKLLRDVVLTHTHLDHIAGLPLFIDDLFSTLETPLRVHASHETCRILKEHVFNGCIYPPFHKLCNSFGKVLEFLPFEENQSFSAAHLQCTPIPVNHIVPTAGLIFSDGAKTFAYSADTAENDEFWQALNRLERLDALFIECALPDSQTALASESHHLTPQTLASELKKLRTNNTQIFVVNIKPMFYSEIVEEIAALAVNNLEIMRTGKEYFL